MWVLFVFRQVFESVEELEQTEAEMKLEAGKRVALPNGGVPEAGSCSPDSGHPSSQNFSVASAYSEQSFSTEDSWPEGGKGGAAQTSGEGPPPAMESTPLDGKGEADGPQGEVSATRTLDAFIGMGQELPGKEEGALSLADHWALPSAKQPNSMGSEDDLSEEPEMESLFPTLDSHSLAITDLTLSEVSPVSSSGVTYSVSSPFGLRSFSLQRNWVFSALLNCWPQLWP